MHDTLNGVRINWREAGAGDALIFIHGFPFDSSMWDFQLAAVPPGWRFIAPDMRGFGESESSGSGPYTMDTYAEDVVALMDHLGIDQAVICGLSMGGYVALSLAKRYPDRVRALVLVDTRANADTAEAKANRLTLAEKCRAEGAKAVIDAMLPHLVSAHTRMKQPTIVQKIRGMMEGAASESLARALEGMAERADYVADLGGIVVSTLVIRGEQDDIIAAGEMELIARTVRGARHEMIALAGHLPNLEASDVFNKILRQFLGYLPPPLKLGDMTLSF